MRSRRRGRLSWPRRTWRRWVLGRASPALLALAAAATWLCRARLVCLLTGMLQPLPVPELHK